MKKFLIVVFFIVAVVYGFRAQIADFIMPENQVYKPMIYLYPEEVTDVSVKLDYDGELTVTYPQYKNGWEITAHPDGTLTDKSGRSYYGLFWEGEERYKYDCSEGFVVEGDKTEAFLEEYLRYLGLNDKEANEFIVFWLPQMMDNKYNLITFQQDDYTERARLEISPEPDNVIRIFMAYKPLDKYVEIPPQKLVPGVREGFTVVEWGGTKLG